jgi:hypothetical protein
VSLLVAGFFVGCIVGLSVGYVFATRPVTEDTVHEDFHRLPVMARKRLWWAWGKSLDAQDGYVGKPPAQQ